MRLLDSPLPERIFSFFRDLVKLESESGCEGKVVSYIKEFCSDLSLECTEDETGQKTSGNAGNLTIIVPPSNSSNEYIILNAHMDTVTPVRGANLIENEERFASDGKTILGADDKAGIAAILALTENLIRKSIPHKGLEIVLTVQEEPGLIGVKNYDFSRLRGRWGYVLDGAGDIGGIIIESPGSEKLKFLIKGRAAHAGVEPEKGRSSILCASKAISRLNPGRIDEETTSNIGIIKGGRATNIVPDETFVEGEIRSFNEEKLIVQRERFIKTFEEEAEALGCKAEISVERSFDHFKIQDNSRALFEIERAMEICEIKPERKRSGGGSDANVFNKNGFEMVVLDVGIQNAHSKDEFIFKEHLVLITTIIHALVKA